MQDNVPLRYQAKAALGGDLAALLAALFNMAAIARVPHGVVVLAGGDGITEEVATGDDAAAAGAVVAHLGCGEMRVAPCNDDEGALASNWLEPGAGMAADIQPGYAFDAGFAEVALPDVVGAQDRGAADVDVAPGYGAQAVAGADAPADVVEIGAGTKLNLRAVDVSSGVVQVVGGDVDHGAAGDGAAVDKCVGELGIKAAAADEGAGAVDVALAYTHVKLWHQHAAGAAVG